MGSGDVTEISRSVCGGQGSCKTDGYMRKGGVAESIVVGHNRMCTFAIGFTCSRWQPQKCLVIRAKDITWYEPWKTTACRPLKCQCTDCLVRQCEYSTCAARDHYMTQWWCS